MLASLPGELRLVVAGISSKGPDAYFGCTERSDDHPVEPRTVHSSRGMVPPGDATLQREVFPPGIRESDVDIDRDGLRLLELQRARFLKPGRGYPMVGGFCQITTVSRDGIATKCLKHWPDRFGERIAA